uniref:Uncharacterized protein n=1 Tax=Leersia perrieri TaxID=77586 RepID=A0A0D9X2V8_9ORYZ
MVAKNPLLVTLLLAGLVARGTEARKAAIISGTVPCTARPNQANVILDISNNMINARTNNDGQFMAVLNVTSSNMMDSLMNGSKVVVVNTPPMACNSSLPADVGTLKLEAPRRMAPYGTVDHLAQLAFSPEPRYYHAIAVPAKWLAACADAMQS